MAVVVIGTVAAFIMGYFLFLRSVSHGFLALKLAGWKEESDELERWDERW